MGTTLTTNRVEKLVKNKSNEKTVPAKPACGNCVDAKIYAEKVEKKAYELYEKRGCQDGHDCEDWLEAERIIEEEMIAGK